MLSFTENDDIPLLSVSVEETEQRAANIVGKKFLIYV